MKYLLSFLVLFCFFTTPVLAQTQSFSIIAMPDVQNESQYYPQVLAAQTKWIAQSKTSLNIQAVLGLGDIVNNGSDDAQWQNADAAYRTLDSAGIPYLLSIGNHDYDKASPGTRQTSGYNHWFGVTRYSGHSWYGGNYNNSNENYYGVLNIGGKQFLILVLEFVPRNEVVEWAESVIDQNPDKEILLVTHSFMYSDNTRVDRCDTQDMLSDNYGEKLWQKLVKPNANVTLVLSGHITNGNGARREDLGTNGNLVNQIFANYQLMTNGGDGYLRILTFQPASNSIEIQTYSPYLNKYLTDGKNQFTVPWHKPQTSATSGTVSGLVRDQSTCKRIAGATVTVGGVSKTTDSNGHYYFTLHSGDYTVNASATGYTSASAGAHANNGYITDTNFFLAQNTLSCSLSSQDPSVTICKPGSGATLSSPVTISAGVTDSNAVNYIQVYIDGVQKVTQRGSVLNASVSITSGSHKVTVQAQDATGALIKKSILINVN